MSRKIPMQVRGKRPRFFEAQGQDELVSMMLEMMAELSVVKERLYALERSAGKAGFPVRDWIENWEPSAADQAELAAERRRLISTVLRAVETDNVDLSEARSDVEATLARETHGIRAA